MCGQSGVQIIPNHKRKDKSNIFFFFFLTIHQEYCQGTEVWEDEERSMYLDEKEKKNLLIFYHLEQESLISG